MPLSTPQASTKPACLRLSPVLCLQLQAAVLVCNQVWNLWDPVLNADPLHAVTYSHFLWASVLFGYLTYDTIYRCVECA